MFIKLYDTLAEQGNLQALLIAARSDERVYDVIHKHKLIDDVIKMLPNPDATNFLSRGMQYEYVNDACILNFVTACSLLQRHKGVVEGATLSRLVGNYGMAEKHRLELFNFSETFRHLILSRNAFPERGAIRCLTYMFSDDYLSDAVAKLQYKSDIMNYVNKVYVSTSDWWSWRFSVRAMSLAGGHNEDRTDVDKTEKNGAIYCNASSDFVCYSVVGAIYARIRHYPVRMRGPGLIPKWLARRRAIFSGIFCGCLGVFYNSYLEHNLLGFRCRYEQRRNQEMRRRRGARKRGVEYEDNKFFDTMTPVTRQLWSKQVANYTVVWSIAALTCFPLWRMKFPAWMGDVVWRYPMVAHLFPVTVNLPCASKCLMPFVFAPFVGVNLILSMCWGANLHDLYVHEKNVAFHMYRGRID